MLNIRPLTTSVLNTLAFSEIVWNRITEESKIPKMAQIGIILSKYYKKAVYLQFTVKIRGEESMLADRMC